MFHKERIKENPMQIRNSKKGKPCKKAIQTLIEAVSFNSNNLIHWPQETTYLWQVRQGIATLTTLAISQNLSSRLSIKVQCQVGSFHSIMKVRSSTTGTLLQTAAMTPPLLHTWLQGLTTISKWTIHLIKSTQLELHLNSPWPSCRPTSNWVINLESITIEISATTNNYNSTWPGKTQ